LKSKRVLGFLETLREQGFLEVEPPLPRGFKEFLDALYKLDITYSPRKLGRSYGCVLKSRLRLSYLISFFEKID